eukprot:640191-Rhodomonas_salina.1
MSSSCLTLLLAQEEEEEEERAEGGEGRVQPRAALTWIATLTCPRAHTKPLSLSLKRLKSFGNCPKSEG